MTAMTSEISAPDVDVSDQEVPALVAASKSAERAMADEPDPAAAAAGDAQEKLVQEAEQQLAQLQLGFADTAKSAEAPLLEQQQPAEGPGVDGAAADSTVGVDSAQKAAGQEGPADSKSAKSKRGSLSKKVLALPSTGGMSVQYRRCRILAQS